MTDNKIMFWENVKSEIDFQGMSYKELAAKSDLLLQSIYNGISRGTSPNLDTAYKIAKALNVSIDYLITGKSKNTDNQESEEIEKLVSNYKKLSKDYRNIIQIQIESLVNSSKQ